MHIAEGVLAPPVLAAGAGLAILGLAIGLRRLRTDQIALCGAMAAVFFVASLIHVPVGISNAHLLLCGLMGVMLGWAAFPAIVTALTLQALLFQYGGLTTLGVNAASMGYAAVLAYAIFRLILKLAPHCLKLAAFAAGAAGCCFAAFLTACALSFTDEGLRAAAAALFVAHLPVILAEGVITMLAAAFMARVKPEAIGLGAGERMPGKRRVAETL